MNELATRPSNPGPALSLGLALERMLADPQITAEKMKIIIDQYEKNQLAMRIEAFQAAFSRLAPKIPRIEKSGRVFDGRGKRMWDYTKIEHMHKHLVPLMAQEGFSIRFYERECTWDPKQTTYVAVLMHEAGHSVESPVTLADDRGPGRNEVQAHGSASSYGRRYAWRNALNIVWEGEDDDAVGTGVKRISAEQVAELNRLIEELGGDIELRTAQVAQLGDAASIEDIRERSFERVKRALLTKRRERGGE